MLAWPVRAVDLRAHSCNARFYDSILKHHPVELVKACLHGRQITVFYDLHVVGQIKRDSLVALQASLLMQVSGRIRGKDSHHKVIQNLCPAFSEKTPGKYAVSVRIDRRVGFHGVRNRFNDDKRKNAVLAGELTKRGLKPRMH